jgi:AraC family transcriptional regulator, transcriptional activator of pobA
MRMDGPRQDWYFSDMEPALIPVWQLYGEDRAFPDVLHVERIVDRAAGLDWRIAPHRHLHLHQIFLLLQGEAEVTLDGRKIDLALPMLLNLPRGVAHGFDFSAGMEGYVLTLPVQELADLFGPDTETLRPLSRPFAAKAGAAIAAAFDALAAEHGLRLPFRRTRLKSLAVQVITDLLRLPEAMENLTPLPGDPRVQRFLDLVEAHFQDGWRVDAYGRALGMSARHLSRLCRIATGLSAGQVIEATTFRAACSLLVYTRMTVASVGYAVGFDDPSYFTRAFQRHLGLSPTQYRLRFDG